MEAVENKMLSPCKKKYKHLKHINSKKCDTKVFFPLFWSTKFICLFEEICVGYHDVHQSIMMIQTLEHRPGLKPVNKSNMMWPNVC